jgi:hypothetical protein
VFERSIGRGGVEFDLANPEVVSPLDAASEEGVASKLASVEVLSLVELVAAFENLGGGFELVLVDRRPDTRRRDS